MKAISRFFLGVYTFLYRLTKGRVGGSVMGTPVLLLITTGRKTGKTRTVPLGYIMDGSNYVIIASAGGQPKHPGWYFNLKANPQATIEVKDQKKSVRAEEADPQKRDQLWQQLITQHPQYKNYEKVETRTIPLMILHPGD